MTSTVECPACGHTFSPRTPVTPLVAVDAIIETSPGTVVLVKRRNPPLGWALPGGFVDVDEDTDTAVAREACEETSLTLHDVRPFGCYSTPGRDPRGHTVSIVYTARASGSPRGGDDAAEARVFALTELPSLAFDHADILADYAARRGGSA